MAAGHRAGSGVAAQIHWGTAQIHREAAQIPRPRLPRLNRWPGTSVMPGSQRAWIRGIDVMPLLERDTQLASLAEYAGEARQGDGRLVLIAGEAGVGKSALVEKMERGLPEATWSWG